MNYRRLMPLVLLLGFCLIFLSGLPVQAQSPPATPAPLKESSADSNDESTPDKYSIELQASPDLSAASVVPIGSTINVAVNNNYDETNPAVALCAYDQYLVVYEYNGNIYGQRLTSVGAVVGSAFVIFDGSYSAFEPDVSCDWTYNRFIVVWTYDYYGDGTDYDIRSQGVYGGHQTSGSQLSGSMLSVAVEGGGVDEQDPAIACNGDDWTCLVVYRRSGTSDDIYARRVSVGASGISSPYASFPLGNDPAVTETSPAVAWGGADNNFLVVWSVWYDATAPTADHYRVVFRHVHDTHQAGDQFQHGPIWLISPGSRDRNQTIPVVAYNRNTRQYLVLFQYDYNGNGSDYDIVALRIAGTGAAYIGSNFPVASSVSHETSSTVAFSGGPENLPGFGGNQFLVSYLYSSGSTSESLYVQGIKGAYDTGGDQRDGAAQVISTIVGSGWYFQLPDVTGSVNNGRYLLVWQSHTGGWNPDDNIFGRLIAPHGVYLPLILRN